MRYPAAAHEIPPAHAGEASPRCGGRQTPVGHCCCCMQFSSEAFCQHRAQLEAFTVLFQNFISSWVVLGQACSSFPQSSQQVSSHRQSRLSRVPWRRRMASNSPLLRASGQDSLLPGTFCIRQVGNQIIRAAHRGFPDFCCPEPDASHRQS